MSTSIEQRVVQMRFDNKQFENSAARTMSTLDKLKEKLNFKNAGKSFDDVSKSASKVSLQSITEQVDKVNVKFNAMAVVAATALGRVTNSAINAGKRITKALTFEPVITGFREYETKMNAIQTIMSNTASKGTTMADVTKVIDELNTYADKTIYNFAEMTRNIGLFTAAGVGLEESAESIKGISNLAASVGTNATDTARVMYQLSQALSSGAVRLQDWRSLESAGGMAGEKFQEALKQTAREQGIAVDKMVEKNGNFRESLKEGWLSTEVLNTTLRKFTVEGAKEYAQAMKESGKYTQEQADALIAEAQAMEDAATKVKTFTQLWSTLQEAAQSGWGKTWEIIIGDFEEAKELLTRISNVVGGFIDASSNARNEMLQTWKDLGGRQMLIDTVSAAFENLLNVVKSLRDGFKDIFPSITAEQLYNATVSVKNFVESLKFSDEALNTLRVTFKALLLPVKALVEGLKVGVVIIGGFIRIVFRLINALVSLPSKIGSIEDPFRKIFGEERYVRITRALTVTVESLQSGIEKVKDKIKELIGGFKSFVSLGPSGIFDKISTVLSPISDFLLDSIVKGFENLSKINFSSFGKSISEVFGNIKNGLSSAEGSVKKFFGQFDIIRPIDILKKISEGIKNIGSTIFEFFTGVSISTAIDFLSDKLNKLFYFFKNVGEAVSNFTGKLSASRILIFSFGLSIIAMIVKLTSVIDKFGEVAKATVNFLNSGSGLLNSGSRVLFALSERIKGDKIARNIVPIAVALTVLTLSLVGLSRVDSKGLMQATISLVAVVGAIAVLTAVIGGITKVVSKTPALVKNIQLIGIAMIEMAGSVAILSSAVLILSKVNLDGLGLKLLSLLSVVGVMILMVNTMGRDAKSSMGKAALILSFSLSMVSIAHAIASISNKDIELSMSASLALIGITRILKNLANAVRGVKFRGGAGMVLIVLSLNLMAKSLVKLSKYDTGELLLGLINFLPIIATLKIISKALGSNEIVKMGGNILGVSVSILLLMKAIEYLGKMDIGVIIKGGAVVSALILVFGLMLKLAGSSQHGGAKMKGAFISMGLSILVLGLAIKYIGDLDLKTVIQGTLVVSALLYFLSILATSLSSTSRATKSIAAIAVCIGLLASSIALLSLLDPAELLASSSALSIAMLAIGFMIKSIGSFKLKSASASVGFLTIIIAELGFLFKHLNDLDPEGMLATATALSEVMLVLSGVTRIMSFSGNKGTAVDYVKSFGSLIAMLALAGTAIFMINQMPIENGLFEKTASLSLLLGTLTGIAVAIDKLNLGGKGSVGKEASGAAGIAAVTGIIFGLFVAIGALFEGLELAGINLEEILGHGIDVINSMYRAIPAIGAMAAVAKAAQMLGAGGFASIGAGASGAATIDAVFAIITALVLGIGALFEHTDWEKYIDKAITVFPKIGQAIGGLVGGFGEGIISGFLTSFATDMSTFMDNFQPFLNGLKNITPDKVEAVANLGKMLLTLTAVDLATSIMNFLNIFGSENSLATFGDKLVEFGPKIAEFGDSIKDVNSVKIVAVSTLMSSLAEILAQIPTEGGILDFLFGHKDFEGFSSGMSGLATGLKDFIKEIDNADITTEAVEKVKIVTTALTDLANSIPRSGGILEGFFGSKDMGVFGTQLKTFATGLVGFFKIISGKDEEVGEVNIDEDLATKAANIGMTFAKFADAIPSTGGKLQIITGMKDMRLFGVQLKGYARALVAFCNIISGKDEEVGEVNIDEELAGKAASIGETFANLTKKLPGTGGIWQGFVGSVDLSSFGVDIAMFGIGMATFFKAFKGQSITQDDVDTAGNAGTAFTDLVNNLKPNKGFLSAFSSIDLSQYGTQLGKLGEGMGTFYSNIKNVSFDTVNRAVTEIDNILGLNDKIKSVNVSSANVFSTYLNNLAMSALDKFGEAFDNGTDKLTNKIVNSLRTIFKNASDKIGQSTIDFSGLMNAVSNSIMQGKSVIESRASDIAIWFKDAFVYNSFAFKECGRILVKTLIDEMDSETDSSVSRIKEIFDDIIEAVKDVFDIKNNISNKFKKIGENCIDGLIKGFSTKFVEANSKIRAASTNFVNTAAKAMGVNSPSTKFAEIGKYCIQGLANGIGDNERTAINRAVKMGENVLNSIREFFGINSPSTVTRDEVGRYIVEGIAEGIENNTSAEEAAERKAQNIVEAFQKEFDKLDQVLNTKNLEYELWQSMNPNASTGESNVKQVEMLDTELKNQAERVSLANAKYQTTLKSLGENASQTREAYDAYLQEKINLADLANELSEFQSSNIEAYKSFAELYSSNYDMLTRMGFSKEDITKAYKDQSGYVDSEILDKVEKAGSIEDIMKDYMELTSAGSEDVEVIIKQTTKKAVDEASKVARTGGRNTVRSFNQGITEAVNESGSGGKSSVESAFDSITSSVKEALPGIEEGKVSGGNLIKGIEKGIDSGSKMLTDAGSAASKKISGVIDWIDNKLGEHSPSIYTKQSGINLMLGLSNGILDPEANSTVNGSAETVSLNILSKFEEYSQKYNGVGVQMMQGLANGISSGRSLVINSATSVATQALNKVQTVLGIHSPSREFYRIGKMIDQGLSNGLMDDYSIVDGSISMITDRIQQSEEDFLIEPVIDMSGVEDGVNDISKMFDDLYVLQWSGKGELLPTYAGYKNNQLASEAIRTLSVDKKTYEAAMKAAYPDMDAISHRAYNKNLTANEERLLVDLWRQGITQANNIGSNDDKGVYSHPVIQYSQNITSPTPANAAEIARRTNNVLNKLINSSNDRIHSGTNA